jgi:hypothetical protein
MMTPLALAAVITTNKKSQVNLNPVDQGDGAAADFTRRSEQVRTEEGW